MPNLNTTPTQERVVHVWTDAEKADVIRRLEAGESYGALSKEKGLSYESIRRVWRNRGKPSRGAGVPQAPAAALPGSTRYDETETALFVELDRQLQTKPTLEYVLDSVQVDQREWAVDRWLANRWDVTAKTNSGDLVTRSNWQIKVWFKRRAPRAVIRAWDSFIAELKETGAGSPEIPQLQLPQVPGEDVMLEVSVPDPHLGKRVWGVETGGPDWDSGLAAKAFVGAIAALLGRATKHYNVVQVALPIGNDFFNVDNAAGTTTAGTPQDEDGRYQLTFRRGIRALQDGINLAAAVAPVRIEVVPGNHDTERMWYAGEVLAAIYADSKRVTIDNAPNTRKYLLWESTLLGWTHGKDERPGKLPLVMATDVPDLWAASKHREWHLGHIHHKSTVIVPMESEDQRVRVRYLPSLCPPDAWHVRNLFNGLRAAEVYIWGAKSGYLGHLSHTIY